MDLEIIERTCINLNIIRNDFIYLHVNSFGHSFKNTHETCEEYYKHLQDDIDDMMEIYAGCSEEKIAVPFNLNRHSESNLKSIPDTPEDIFEMINQLCELVVENLENARTAVDANGYIAMIDGMLEYWTKQARYISARFCI